MNKQKCKACRYWRAPETPSLCYADDPEFMALGTCHKHKPVADFVRDIEGIFDRSEEPESFEAALFDAGKLQLCALASTENMSIAMRTHEDFYCANFEEN